MNRILVTGSAGHLGEAMIRTLRRMDRDAIGLDILPSPFTDVVGSITEPSVVEGCMKGVDAVVHAARLHKPHLAIHTREAFVSTNIHGTLVLLEAAVRARVSAFVYTSTTSAFGDALVPPEGAPASLSKSTASLSKSTAWLSKSTAWLSKSACILEAEGIISIGR